MKKIDLKDRRILYELDINSRQSFRSIGRKVGLSKDIVALRVKKLKETGIIKNFFTEINTFSLGYNVFRIYITYQYASEEVKNEIIQHFISYKNVWAIASSKGEIDLSIIIWVDDNYEFYTFWNKTLDLFEDYFSRATISLYIEAREYKKSYLLLENFEKSNRELFRITCSKNKVKVDNIDYKILNEIALNARFSTVELAKKLNCSTQIINNRFKNLIKNGIIKAFRVSIDYSKLGVYHYRVYIYLKEHKKLNHIINYLEDKPYLQCLNVTVGWGDIEPEFIVKNFDELSNIMEEINFKFPNVIKKYSFLITDKYHIERWLPNLF